MTYLITEQTTTQSLKSKTDLCKCDHREFHHVDEERHSACRYCSCDQFDPQWSSFLYYTITNTTLKHLKNNRILIKSLQLVKYGLYLTLCSIVSDIQCALDTFLKRSLASLWRTAINFDLYICRYCTNYAHVATSLHRSCIFCVKRCSIIYACLLMPLWRMQ